MLECTKSRVSRVRSGRFGADLFEKGGVCAFERAQVCVRARVCALNALAVAVVSSESKIRFRSGWLSC